MAVDAIGSSLGTQQNSALAQSSTIDQEDFIRLFLAQLQFQDPLEPVDNREFLAQLAQFSALEQSRQLSENTASMLAMSASDQAVGLLNRQVDLTNLGVTRSGTVVAVQFGQRRSGAERARRHRISQHRHPPVADLPRQTLTQADLHVPSPVQQSFRHVQLLAKPGYGVQQRIQHEYTWVSWQ